MIGEGAYDELHAGRTRDLEYIRSLGTDAVVDTGATRFEDVVGPMDVVIDTVGGDLQTRSLGAIRAGGTLVSAVSQPDPEEAARRGVRASFILVDVNREALTRIGALLAARTIEGRLGPTLPLGEARRAHQMLDGLVPRPRARFSSPSAEGPRSGPADQSRPAARSRFVVGLDRMRDVKTERAHFDSHRLPGDPDDASGLSMVALRELERPSEEQDGRPRRARPHGCPAAPEARCSRM